MTTYYVADGSNNEAYFVAVNPQPRCEGVKATRTIYNPDGTITREGLYIELEFDMVGSATEYQALLNQFGLQSAETNEVTIGARDETFADDNYNGVAIRPEPGQDVRWRKFMPRDIVILIKDLSDT